MNIDKKNKSVKDGLLEELEDTGYGVDDGQPDEIDDFEFDLDGNMNDDFDDDDENDDFDDSDDDFSSKIEDDDLDDLDDDAEDTEDEPEPDDKPEPKHQKKSSKKLTPAEIKLINLKKELAKVTKRNSELEKLQQQKELDKERVSIKEKYQEKGYDEDTADVYAQNEIRMKQLEERQQIFDFREENEDVFRIYPQAKADAATIMRNSKLTGMSAEQICKGLYGEVSERETRAINAVKGVSSKQGKDDMATKAIKSSSAKSEDSLSQKDLKYKKFLEKKFNGGKPITVEEYKKYMK